jgi:hypothetical protein
MREGGGWHTPLLLATGFINPCVENHEAWQELAETVLWRVNIGKP